MASKAAIDEGDDSAEERYALAAADYNAAVSREEQVAAVSTPRSGPTRPRIPIEGPEW